MKFRLSILFFLLSTFSIIAQNQTKGKLQGTVIEESTKNPIPFTSVRIFSGNPSKLVTGGISNEKGNFSIDLPTGVYDILIESIGFEPLQLKSISITKEKSSQNLGTIQVKTSNKTLQEVTVKSQKSSMELALDKRTFNIGTDLANKGASAAEILGNLPSIQVDGEGSVRLRGSENVRILIDGKPSTLLGTNGSSGLSSLQGNMIEKVEIITNPSARYEAEGMAGIINIILKKNQNQGFNAAYELNLGYPENFGGTAILNYRKNKLNFFINYGLFYRRTPGRSDIYQEVKNADGGTNYLQQNNANNVRGLVNNIRGGADYYFNEKTILTGSYIFRRTDVRRISDFHYEDFKSSKLNLYSITDRQQDEKEAEPNAEYALTFKKSFVKKGKEFSADLRYLDYWEKSDQLFTQVSKYADGSPYTTNSKVQTSINDEFEHQWILQADYVNPISKDAKIETGLRTSFRDMINDYWVKEKDSNGNFNYVSGLKNLFNYKEKITAELAIIGNKAKKIPTNLD